MLLRTALSHVLAPISWNPTSLKCQFTTSHWRNWHSFSLFPAFITHLTSTPPQIPTSYDSCMHFLYPNLSPNSSLSLLLRLSLVFLLSLSSSVRPGGCHHYAPASSRSPLTPFLRCCPDSRRQLLQPASLCGARGGATSQRRCHQHRQPSTPSTAYSAYQRGLFCISQLFSPTGA